MMTEIEKQVLDALNEIFQRSGFSLIFKKNHLYETLYETEMVFLVSDTRSSDDVTTCCWKSVHDMFIKTGNHDTLFSELKYMKKNIVRLDEISGFQNFSRFIAVCDQHSLESLAGCSCLEEVLLKLSCLR